MNEGANSSVCRICAELGLCINIFSELGRTQGLQSKITECLSLTITEQDVLPKSVCLNCITKLNTSFELKMTCITAQAKLQALSIQTNPADTLPKTIVASTPAKTTPNQTVVTAASSSNEIQQYFMYPNQVLDAPEGNVSGKNILNNANNPMGVSVKSTHSVISASGNVELSTRVRKKERKTVCQYCRKWFPRTIIAHHENLHIKGGVFFTCVICNNNFRTKQEFSSHRCDQ